MSSTVYTFADSTLRMRYAEPYVSAAFNREKIGTAPIGIYRGFNIVPHATLTDRVYIKADALADDHVALVQSNSGSVEYGITVRLMSDIVMDLTAFANKTVALALRAVYTTGALTSCTIQAYEVAPVNTLTIDPEFAQLTILGEVTIPGVAAVLSNSAVTFQYRNEAWTTVGRQFRPWTSIIRNGSFEIGVPGLVNNSYENNIPYWDLSSTNSAWYIDNANSHEGAKALKLNATGAGAVTASANQKVGLSVRQGQKLHVEFWTKSTETATRHLQIILKNTAGAPLSLLDVPFTDTAGGVFTKHTITLQMPDTAGFITNIFVNADYTATIGGAAFWVDSLQVWAEDLDGRQDNWQDEQLIRNVFTSGLVLEQESTPNYLTAVNTGATLKLVGSTPQEVQILPKDNLGAAVGLYLPGSIRVGQQRAPSAPAMHVYSAGDYSYVMHVEVPGQSIVRLYSSTTSQLAYTRNAQYNDSAGAGAKWSRDNGASAATKISLSDSELAILTHDATNATGTTPWGEADWTNYNNPAFKSKVGRVLLGGGTDIAATAAPGTSALWASNIPKCWGTVTVTSAGPPNTLAITSGFNIASVAFSTTDLQINFATNMADANYAPVIQQVFYNTGGGSVRHAVVSSKAAGNFTIRFFDANGTTIKDISSNAAFVVNVVVMFTVFGNQG